jgi:sugar/nucleoside kinase (ribokinase family)
LSLGSKGAVVSVTPNIERLQQLSSSTTNEAKTSSSSSTTFSSYNPSMCISQWIPGSYARIPAYEIDGEVNANGAGDALFAGFCLAASSWGSSTGQKVGSSSGSRTTSISNDCAVVVTPQVAGTFASLVAWQRCDTKKRDGIGMMNAVELMNTVCNGDLPKAIVY